MTVVYTIAVVFQVIYCIALIAMLICMLRPPKVKFWLAGNDIKMPRKRDEDVGYDIYPHFRDTHIVIPPHHTELIHTGIHSVIPKGYYFQLKERSSTGSKTIIQQAGVIDPGYRGEWLVPITNGSDKPLAIAKDCEFFDPKMTTIIPYDSAICQAVLEAKNPAKVMRISSAKFKKLCDSERGSDGFGSTNRKKR